MATNPFGYGNMLPFTQAQFSNQNLFPTHWLTEQMELAGASVYFPQVTPMKNDLMVSKGQNIVVPINGQMNDTSWPGLTVGTSLTVGSWNVESIAVTVTEAGRGVAMDRAAAQYIVDGMYPGEAKNYVSRLMHNFAMSWENTMRSIYLGGQFTLTSVAQGSVWGGSLSRDIGGTGLASGAGTLSDFYVDMALDEFRSVHTGTLGTFTVQPFSDGLYRMVGNWKTLKGIAKSADFKSLDVNTTSNGQRQIYQEIGPWNGFMFVRHDLMPDGTVLAHGANVAVQGFGGQFDVNKIPPENISSVTDPLPVQIRLEPDYQGDFYRGMAAAWYTMAGSSAAFRDMGTHAIRINLA